MTVDPGTELELFLEKLHSAPENIEFTDTIALVNACYEFTPTAFRNDTIFNQPGQNIGSCKIFAFARLHDLDKQQTLACFGSYYRADVLKNPDAENHQNIRQFMKTGWKGIEFNDVPLRAK